MTFTGTEATWLVRRILAREIEVEYTTRRSLNVNLKLGISNNSFANGVGLNPSDLDLVQMLRSDLVLIGVSEFQMRSDVVLVSEFRKGVSRIPLRDKIINICQELRLSHEMTDHVVEQILG